MKTLIQPNRSEWSSLMQRATAQDLNIENTVREILNEVKRNGDQALLDITKRIDQVDLANLQVSVDELNDIIIDSKLAEAIQLAKANIEKFHSNQLVEESVVETMKGVNCWRKAVPIQKVGLYIPGGSAPLFSTVLMLGIPAMIAGCKKIILCTPPKKDGSIDPAILYTAKLIGIEKIYKVGGVQAIGAMTYGTETIEKVYKIFGPGNSYVTKAKELVQTEGVAIDMPAGPSEVLVIADRSANPVFVAADLLSQAEHGADSQVILLSDSNDIVQEVIDCLLDQKASLPRVEIVNRALNNSRAIILEDLDTCMEWSNLYAPEHLIINAKEDERLASMVENAGSVFIGPYSCESAGDYASGTNHTLPTNAYAQNYSGVSVDSFMKKITFQQLSKEGIQNIGPAIEIMAEAEGLEAHKMAVSVRLNNDEMKQ